MELEIKDAIAKLREGKKRKFDQTLDLIVNLKDFDVRKEALNTFVSLPHPIKRKVAAFFTKKNPLVETITEKDFPAYDTPKAMKKLAKSYDIFIASTPMMNKVATKFGRVFGPLGKMPSPQAGIIPQETEEAVKEVLKKVEGLVRVRNKEKAIKLAIGKESMKDEELAENFNAVLKALISKFPRGKSNIKEVLIKFTMSTPVRVKC